MSTEAERARKLRRRHMHERQAVVFGVLVAFLALAFVTAAAVYTGNLNLPWVSREFTNKPAPTPTTHTAPCPPTGALPVAANQITVNVYNGAGTTGLAKNTADALRAQGFLVGTYANAVSSFDGTARINFGVSGIAQAYTIAAWIDGAEFQLDGRQDASVDITLGASFVSVKAPDTVTLDPSTPLVGPAGCIPYDEYISQAGTLTSPAGTGTTAPADGATAPAEGQSPAAG